MKAINQLLLPVFILALIPIIFVEINAQQQYHCGFDHYVQQLASEHPNMAEKKALILSRDNDVNFRTTEEIYTIKTVVHLVENGSKDPITDQQVIDMIDVLTADFRRQNADTNNIRPIFKDVAGDARIEFDLVEIIRVQTDTTFAFSLLGGLPDHVKQSANGGSDAVDPTSHMNIWVCTIEGGAVLGYATPPDGLPNWPAGSGAPSMELDGVVVHDETFKAFGEIVLQGDTTQIRGRTLTHEVGHYLGLRHTWGDGLLTLLGIPNCDEDDGVEDTPMQGLQTSFSCDTTLNTCDLTTDSLEIDLPDMIENYMDYTDEACKSAFTNGQIQIMRGVLENERKGLLGLSSSQSAKLEPLKVNVYPNPVAEVLHISNDSQETLYLNLYSFNGQQVIPSKICSPGTTRILLTDYSMPAGIYFLELTGEKGSMTQKLIYQSY